MTMSKYCPGVFVESLGMLCIEFCSGFFEVYSILFATYR